MATLLYGDVFTFPMNAAEIHHFLIGTSASQGDVEHALMMPSPWLKIRIINATIDDCHYYAVHNRSSEIFEQRRQRQQASAILWSKAKRHGRYLGMLPFVRMVALTGSLALHNASDPKDDLDYLLIVRDGRVWLARLFAIVLVRICKLWGVTLCPNYVLSSQALAQKPQSLFLAHEVTQMVPLVGHLTYRQMRRANDWTAHYLPNAEGAFYQENDAAPKLVGRWFKRIGELIFSGPLGNWLERWEMRRKIRKFSPQIRTSIEAQLDEERVKGHFIDYGHITLQQYQQRLEDFGLSEHTSAAD